MTHNYEPLFEYIDGLLKPFPSIKLGKKGKDEIISILSDIHKMTEEEAGELFDREADEEFFGSPVIGRSAFITLMTERGGK